MTWNTNLQVRNRNVVTLFHESKKMDRSDLGCLCFYFGDFVDHYAQGSDIAKHLFTRNRHCHHKAFCYGAVFSGTRWEVHDSPQPNRFKIDVVTKTRDIRLSKNGARRCIRGHWIENHFRHTKFLATKGHLGEKMAEQHADVWHGHRQCKAHSQVQQHARKQQASLGHRPRYQQFRARLFQGRKGFTRNHLVATACGGIWVLRSVFAQKHREVKGIRTRSLALVVHAIGQTVFIPLLSKHKIRRFQPIFWQSTCQRLTNHWRFRGRDF